MASLSAVVRAMRLHQWTKNLFVFAPVVFAKQLHLIGPVAESITAFLSVSFAASACYVVNDIQDLEADRQHPKKRLRPIASGELPLRDAWALCGALFALSAVMASLLGWWTLGTVALYVAVTLSYSYGLKHIPLLELFLVAAGFVIRILVGSAATGLQASPWLLLTTLFLSLLLAFGKRRGEIGRMGDEAPSRRRVLEFYGLPFLDRSITLLAGASLLCYAIYTTADVTVRKMGTEWLIATTPFVAYGVLRYLYIVEHGNHAADSPSELLLHDRSIQLAVLLWVVTAVLIIYTAP
ncbi:MAG: decaprenyl-phosphate phosphoribosyltransferase [Armatimonadetes bacterium]|jgi:4-hydroxybenzoate polyprenyltransferase|nr:decaprenyl-phosphate phosphoribosyltransferase [Armatimonadota bacterium]MDI9602123.1 decaprenyl-phosphate phosphoribosyltransferase [Acidobacteriota bacterium]NLN89260.1 decaprenyl-phosphate phosphoribosyltransferase [candidate division WS1 bacterium]